ncbi:DUF3164 family protein [Pseudoduganella sp. RAF19]|uniref:DUF3164 family protein n=2 Tax=unclassified Pseudoduganella TaxID=2637179 RepID=UPI003F95EE55
MTDQTEYMTNPKGHLVPVSQIKEIDLMRDKLVMDMVSKAQKMSDQLAQLKGELFADVQAFIELSAGEYSVKVGGDKGNVTLQSYDGKYQVKRAIQESLTFDERLVAAKALIDSCLQRWSEGAQPELQVLVHDAFQVDKAGNINTGRVLGLRRYKITDEEWMRAMQAISDAVQVNGSKSYIRILERVGDSEKFSLIPLDIAGV